jgi:hypothetical protein
MVLFTMFNVCIAQKQHDQEVEKMTARIESIVQRAAEPLDLSDPASPIRITSSQITFDRDDIAEVQKYGPKAGPVLAKYLLNKNSRIERVAIRLLGAIGGPEIGDPLLEVLDKPSSPRSREESLRNLKQAPCNRAVARAMLRASKNDPDPSVREEAQRELNWCAI